MEQMTWRLLILAIVGLFVSSSQAITCYSCKSQYSPDCGDPFKSVNTTCNGPVCVKIEVQEADGRYKATYLLVSFIVTFITSILTYKNIHMSYI